MWVLVLVLSSLGASFLAEGITHPEDRHNFLLLLRLVGRRPRVRACSVLASIMQVRLQYNSLRGMKRLIRFDVQIFSWLPDHLLLDAHRR